MIGALIGLISTLIISMLDLSHLERKEPPKSFEEPEKIFSSSFFSIMFLSGSSFLGIARDPYIIRYLGGADYIAFSNEPSWDNTEHSRIPLLGKKNP
ncbi:MAG: hypothetical protein QXH24_02350 [Candidatus Bathyarchaeia archaeon]